MMKVLRLDIRLFGILEKCLVRLLLLLCLCVIYFLNNRVCWFMLNIYRWGLVEGCE